MSLRSRLVVLFLLQALVLVGMIGDRQWILASGTPVVLEPAPVDPRSLFSGDYVRLQYRISRLDPRTLEGDDVFSRHDPIYVVLAPGPRYWEPVSIHSTMPAVSDGRVVIRGEVAYGGARRRDRSADSRVQPEVLSVRYGIESYFIPEGEGRSLERPAPEDRLAIRVAVDRNGRAAIAALLVNGEEAYVERMF